MVRRQNSTAAEEVARSSVSSLTRAGLVRKDIQPSKLVPTFPWIDNCLIVTKSGFLENGSVTMTNREIPKWKCCSRLVVHLVLLGSSCPYP